MTLPVDLIVAEHRGEAVRHMSLAAEVLFVDEGVEAVVPAQTALPLDPNLDTDLALLPNLAHQNRYAPLDPDLGRDSLNLSLTKINKPIITFLI